MMKGAQLVFLGTGTSQGVPIIGCGCGKCRSTDPRDRRFRSSVLVRYGGLTVLVDAGPDFRSQMIAAGVVHLDAILLTHNHKDHTGGLDDVRALNYVDHRVVDIYCEDYVLEALRKEYEYAFREEKYPGAPEWHIRLIGEKPFVIYPDLDAGKLTWIRDKGYRYVLPDGRDVPTGNPLDSAEAVDDPSYSGTVRGSRGDGVEVIPIRGYHDRLPVLGFRFGNIAYITDMSRIDGSELSKLRNLDHVTINTVGYRPHHSHFSLEEAVALAGVIGAKNTWLTHLSHTFPKYDEFCLEIENLCRRMGIGNTRIRPAYDGLVLE